MSDEEIEIKDEALSPEEINSFWKRLKKTPKATIIAYLITFLTAGGGGYMAAFWQDSVSSAAVEELKDPDSNLSRAISTRVESSMLEALTEVKEDIKEEMLMDVMENMTTYSNIYNALSGFQGMTDERMIEYVKEKFMFADSIERLMPELVDNHEWVKQQRNGAGGSEYVICGTVEAKDGKPKYFVDCDGTRRKVYYGRPSGMNLNSGNRVFYYRNEDDNPILISYLSNY